MRKYIATIAGEKREVSIEATGENLYKVQIGAQSFTLDASEPFLLDGSPLPHALRFEEGRFVVELEAHPIEVEIEDARSAALKTHSARASGKVSLRAPMPGKISRILVKEGDHVKERQGIVVLEAMKMENELKSPISGVVTKVLPASRLGTTANGGEELAVIDGSL